VPKKGSGRFTRATVFRRDKGFFARRLTRCFVAAETGPPALEMRPALMGGISELLRDEVRLHCGPDEMEGE
jgi:hypothetical protein